jgi:hypothetical protein
MPRIAEGQTLPLRRFENPDKVYVRACNIWVSGGEHMTKDMCLAKQTHLSHEVCQATVLFTAIKIGYFLKGRKVGELLQCERSKFLDNFSPHFEICAMVLERECAITNVVEKR